MSRSQASNLRRDAQTSLSPAPSFSSSRGIPRYYLRPDTVRKVLVSVMCIYDPVLSVTVYSLRPKVRSQTSTAVTSLQILHQPISLSTPTPLPTPLAVELNSPLSLFAGEMWPVLAQSRHGDVRDDSSDHVGHTGAGYVQRENVCPL